MEGEGATQLEVEEGMVVGAVGMGEEGGGEGEGEEGTVEIDMGRCGSTDWAAVACAFSGVASFVRRASGVRWVKHDSRGRGVWKSES